MLVRNASYIHGIINFHTDGDGVVELVVGRTDRVLQTYHLDVGNGETAAQLVQKSMTIFPNQLGSMGMSNDVLYIAQPGKECV